MSNSLEICTSMIYLLKTDLESYAVKGELERFTDLVAELEEEQLDAYIKLI